MYSQLTPPSLFFVFSPWTWLITKSRADLQPKHGLVSLHVQVDSASETSIDAQNIQNSKWKGGNIHIRDRRGDPDNDFVAFSLDPNQKQQKRTATTFLI